jgi:aryl-alcohol dehydrogenase-like predicted oxidoreductase
LLARTVEWDIQGVAQRYGGIGLLPWSPLAGGLLTGKYDRSNRQAGGGALDESRVKWADNFGWEYSSLKKKGDDTFYDIIDELKSIAAEIDSTPAAVALRWLLQQRGVSSVTIGARTVEQLKQNLAASSIELSEQHIERLTKVSQPLAQPPYPYDLISTRNQSRHREQQILP